MDYGCGGGTGGNPGGGGSGKGGSSGPTKIGGGGSGISHDYPKGGKDDLPTLFPAESPQLAKITASTTLTKDQTMLLDGSLQQILKDCIEKSYYDYLVDKEQRFHFSIDPKQKIPAKFNSENLSITFKNQEKLSDYHSFAEELFHAYQNTYHPGGISQYSDTGRSNIEFEAKLMRDIELVTKGLPCCFTVNINNDINAKYVDWINEITSDATSYPKIFDVIKEEYSYFLTEFVKTFPKYGSPTNRDLQLKALINLYQTSGCVAGGGLIINPK